MRSSIIVIALVCLSFATQKVLAQSANKLDPSSQIEGTYKVSQMTIFTPGQAPKVVNLNQSGNQMSAVITAKRKSERYVSLTFSQSQNSIQILSFRYGDAYLRTTSKGYDLAIDGNKVGKTDGRDLTIDISAIDKEKGTTRRSLIVCEKSQ